MATIGSIIVNLVARTSLFDRKMRKSQTTVRSFGSTLKNVGSTVLRFGAAAAAAGTAMAIGFAFAVREELKLIDATAKLAKITGDTTEGILRLRHAAILSGSSAATLDKSLLKLSARLGEAKMGTGEATDALEALQLSVKELVKLRPSEAFLRIADAVRKLQTQAEKSSVVKDLFGRAGQDFLVMLDEGSEGIEKLGGKLSKLALFTLEEAAAVERFNDALTNISAALRGVLTQIAVKMAPRLAAIAENLEKIEGPARNISDSFAGIGSAIASAVTFTADFVDNLKLVFAWTKRIADILAINQARFLLFLARAVTLNPLAKAVGGMKTEGIFSDIQKEIEKFEKESAEELRQALLAPLIGDAVRHFFKKVDDIFKSIGDALPTIKRPMAGIDTVDVGLKSQADAIIAATRTPFEKFAQMEDLISDLLSKELITRQTANRAWEQAAEKLRQSILKVDPIFEQMKSQAQSITDAFMTPAEALQRRQDQLNRLLAAELITRETANRAWQHAIEQSINKVEGISPREGMFRAIDPRFISAGGASPARMAERTRKALLNESIKQTAIFEEIRDKPAGLAA